MIPHMDLRLIKKKSNLCTSILTLFPVSWYFELTFLYFNISPHGLALQVAHLYPKFAAFPCMMSHFNTPNSSLILMGPRVISLHYRKA